MDAGLLCRHSRERIRERSFADLYRSAKANGRSHPNPLKGVGIPAPIFNSARPGAATASSRAPKPTKKRHSAHLTAPR